MSAWPGQFPFRPGHKRQRHFSNYNNQQDEYWRALNSAYYAFTEGRLETRLPRPGRAIDIASFRAWQKQVEERWAVESNRDKTNRRGIRIDDWPETLWIWLYQRLGDAKGILPTRGAYEKEQHPRI
jgi:hypothetical protein